MDSNASHGYSILRKQIAHFSAITDSDWSLLLPHLQERKLSKNELLIKEGKRASELGLVIKGMFRQYYTKDGEEKATYFLFLFTNTAQVCI
jgi:CRP-like cAMP-binding protein